MERTSDEGGFSFSSLSNNTNSRWWRDRGLMLNILHCTGLYFCVIYLGYDASLLNGLQAQPQWIKYFNDPTSSDLGLISASLFLPAIITPYVASWCNTLWGRKVSLAIGSCILIVGAIINALAINRGMFIAGRVLVGAAGPFGKVTGVALLQEIAHPRLRPILASIFYCNYYVGSICAAWFCYGALQWEEDNMWAWRAPCLFQVVAPGIVLIYLLFIPESPRWLIAKGQDQKAIKILAKYHANGYLDDALVKYEHQEICRAIKLEEESKNVRYRDFVATPGNRRRLLVLITMATGTNWVGNGIISYYLTPVLQQIGLTDYSQISLINGGLAIWNLFLSYLGALNAERAGRRPLWLASTLGMLLSYTIITGLSAGYAHTGRDALGIATIPWLYIFYGWYCIGWTPLPFSYGAEILPYHMRLKGLSMMLSVQSVAQAFNQWVNPVALAAMGWRYYIVYVAPLCGYLVLVYLFFPETRRLTIEEVSLVFDMGRLGSGSAATAKLRLAESPAGFSHESSPGAGFEQKGVEDGR